MNTGRCLVEKDDIGSFVYVETTQVGNSYCHEFAVSDDMKDEGAQMFGHSKEVLVVLLQEQNIAALASGRISGNSVANRITQELRYNRKGRDYNVTAS